MRKHKSIGGSVQIGNGKPSELHSVTVTEHFGNQLDIMLSADGRVVWLTLPLEEVRKLVGIITEGAEELKDK